MTRITFIGAGSIGFTRTLVRDILTFPRLANAELVLMDIDKERLEFAERSVKRIIELGKYPATVKTTLSRAEALQGADVVMVTILAGGVQVWRHDIEIPKQYGIDINVGDTRGPSGIFRALRTIPEMLNIAKDMERYCPNAMMLNYTNPMAMLCRAMQLESNIQLTGLCHSVQGTAEMLARWVGVPYDEIDYVCAGINHMAWYVKFEHNNQDLYPRIRAAMQDPKIYNEEQVRNEMYLNLDYYVTESSGHNSEYNAWFRKRPDLIEKYCTHGTGWNPGHHAYILNEYLRREHEWRNDARSWFDGSATLKLDRGHEYAAYIVNALAGGEPFRFNGNVRNTGLITNLPQDACVEVPVFVDKDGLHPVHVGALPAQCAMLTGLSSQIEEMAVAGAISGDARMIYHAILNDPLTAAVLAPAEIRAMVNQMFAQNKEYLPQFKHTVVA
ncbi:MAG: alpha-galactosidase [Roseiflexaceae bacterium]|jgi:alpha-galactosidase|nr:alpha-galactosidase [Chloroflexaceae bacterium]MCE2852084.1 alpha-galactosidase [Chloroflexaceae bacterium]